MMQQKDIKQQIEKITGQQKLSRKEFDELENFIKEFESEADVNALLQSNWDNSNNQNVSLSFDKVKNKIEPAGKAVSRTKIWLEVIASSIAACLIVGILITGWNLTKEDSPSIYVAQQINMVEPTDRGSIILTSGGERFDLSSRKINIEENGVAVKGTNKTLKVTSRKNSRGEKLQLKPVWNTISVPKGRDYYVELSDGTQVWLNAGTKLSFPNVFQSNERSVKLEGEAYFKVTSDEKHPFYVSTNSEIVRVTGTQFNVCAYTDEPVSMITLVEGKVDVEIEGSMHALLPGQQLKQEISKSKININDEEVSLYTSWINGVFEFRDMTLQEIAYRLNKWYDVQFEFQDEAAKQRFSGMIKRTYDLEYFFEVIEKTTNVEFVLSKKDRKVIVKET